MGTSRSDAYLHHPHEFPAAAAGFAIEAEPAAVTDQQLAVPAAPCRALVLAACHASVPAKWLLAFAVAPRPAVHAAELDRSVIEPDQPAVSPAAAAAR